MTSSNAAPIGVLLVNLGTPAASEPRAVRRYLAQFLSDPRVVDLPLALPVILAGIKTAAVISVGTATIAAFIGAGGYGERIATGLALNDTTTLLAGAVPAAVLALLVQGGFEVMEWWLRRRSGALLR